jgi:glycosyltransferase involved in cell wall biosynthesis
MDPSTSLVSRARTRLIESEIQRLSTWIGWSDRLGMGALKFLAHRRALGGRGMARIERLIVSADRQVNPSVDGAVNYRWLVGLLHLDRPLRLALFRSRLAEASLELAEIGNARPHLNQSSMPKERLPAVQHSGRTPGANLSGVDVPGVNVFGDWAATTGLAQAARRLTIAISEAGFGLCLGTVASGAPRDESRVADSLREIPDDRKYAIDLWMLNVNEFPNIGEELLRPPGRKTYAIGVWYWELTTFPDSLTAQMERVDEIWVATTFVQSSFESATDRPVRVVPAIVPDLHGSGRTRTDFGLRDDELIFLFSFDVHSMVARKNPGAVIEAFSRAFGSPNRSGTRLVIKVLNLDRHAHVASWLREAVASVAGVLIEDDLRHEELVDLFMCADSYVSLHRSEGFGFGIAEAMALGKPVIATAYSGNTDFATAANSCQVGYRLREITNEDYLYDEGASEVYRIGSTWAEPDIAQAARWMRVIAQDPQLRRRIGETARATILERYSAAAVVDIVRARLAEVGLTATLDQ